jgi:uncharacterized membrane protein affecting hemolysin expression
VLAVDGGLIPRSDAIDRSALVRFAGSISAKVVVLTVVAVLVAVAVGVTGWSAIGGLQGRVNQMAVVQRALHNQAEADGANYAIRYGVLAALTATTADGRKTALDELAEQHDILSHSINDNQTLMRAAGAGAQLRQAFATVDPAMKAYLDTSQAVDLRQLVGHFTY